METINDSTIESCNHYLEECEFCHDFRHDETVCPRQAELYGEPVCMRCGRGFHNNNQCFAKINIKGILLSPETVSKVKAKPLNK